MKKICSLIVCTGFAMGALLAQVQKGDLSINGSAAGGYTFAESDFDEGWSLGAGISVARLITDHWMIGVDLEDRLEVEGIGLQARYFFNPTSTKNIYFADILGGTGFGNDSRQLTLSLGFNRFIGENLSLEAAANYTSFSGVDTPRLGLGLGIRSFISSDAYGARKTTVSRFGKGTYLLGFGDVQLYFRDNIIQLGLSIENALFVTDRLALGLRDRFSFIHRESEGILDFRSWNHELAAFGRYYLRTSGGRVVPFTELGIGFRDGRVNSENNYDSDSFYWLAEARVGANIFLTPEMALELSLTGQQEGRTQLDARYSNRDLFSEDIYPNFDGELQDRTFQVGFHVGVQFFLRQD